MTPVALLWGGLTDAWDDKARNNKGAKELAPRK